MALSRVTGDEELYVGGVFGLRRVQALREHNITHILSVIDYSLDKIDELRGRFVHMSIDVDDVEDSDLLVSFPRIVRFIEAGLQGSDADRGTTTPVPERIADGSPSHPPAGAKSRDAGAAEVAARAGGGVYVHCAMGKSRSVTAVVAYLLWKHPARFGGAEHRNPDRETTANAAVESAVEWVRRTRAMAEPNDGFMRQLAMWWDMGRPADSDDTVERHPVYQRWLYKREVEESARVGRAPDWIRFEDEAEARGERKGEHVRDDGQGGTDQREPDTEVRCKKCRRVLATRKFVVPHTPRRKSDRQRQTGQKQQCPHVFVEPLSWMRPALEGGDLEGRLSCPNAKCGSSVGRFAWHGFKCSCGEWVCPAISLQRSKVDEVDVPLGGGAASGAPAPDASAVAARMAALGIRMPPSSRKENL